MTVTEPEALDAMLTHHRALTEAVRARVDAFVAADPGGPEAARTLGELVAYLAGEVLPHAEAEERTVYRIARGQRDLGAVLDQMIGEHRILAAATARLAESPDSADAPTQAEGVAALFSAHVARENDEVLPALAANPAVDLGVVLTGMHRAYEAARQPSEDAGRSSADPTSAVVSLLVKAATALARAGESDQACRLTAAGWAAVRESRPELAVRLTAALHGFARKVTTEAVSVALSSPPSERRAADAELDVRSVPPAQRHQLIFATYEQLAPGAGFILVNDHDPKPLGYQFEAEHRGDYTWEYLESGPSVWRVRIGRPAV